MAHHPLIFDQTTGIWYGHEWQFASGDAAGRVAYWPTLAENTPVVERFAGVIAACVITSNESSGSSRAFATTLHLDLG